MSKILVSACLLGINCKYNGKNNYNVKLINYLRDKEYITVCPESESGFGIPRPAVEIKNGRAVNILGEDINDSFHRGIEECLARLAKEDISLAILQSRSPSCGVNQRYDGTFSGKLVKDSGLFAKALKEAGYKVIDVEDL